MIGDTTWWLLRKNAANRYDGALVPTCHLGRPLSGLDQVERKGQGKKAVVFRALPEKR